MESVPFVKFNTEIKVFENLMAYRKIFRV